MIIIGISSYPTESSQEVAKRYAQLPIAPKFIILKGPYSHSEVGLGIKSITLYEFHPSRIQEALEYIRSRTAKIMDVPGYTFSADIWTEVQDALRMVEIDHESR